MPLRIRSRHRLSRPTGHGHGRRGVVGVLWIAPFAAALAVAAAAGQRTAERPPTSLPSTRRLAAVHDYVEQAWTTLARSNRDLPAAARDPKFPPPEGGRWPVYVSRREDRGAIARHLKALLGDSFAELDLRVLPPDPKAIDQQGLLYLPRPYVVPGGRFNEMYGWDSYFIQVGLLRDGKLERARDLADNFVYEVQNYGTVLNANRSYYLTRSQPPFLSEMVLGVYRRSGDTAWLRKALPAVESQYRYWTSGAHVVPGTTLSRYWDFGEGPAPEVVAGERDSSGRTHYDRVRAYYRTHTVSDYDVSRFYDRAHDRLTPLFYKGDRSMRESGFDPSNRFGVFGVDVIHYAPVGLNSLLYQMELDIADMHAALDDPDPVRFWKRRAAARRADMDRFLWDEKAGLYLDYDFETGERRVYPFATTFWPLWVGAASRHQAERVRANLHLFEAPGGLRTSTVVSGSQWDAPYGWAPLQLLAVEGLRRYAFADDADRISRRFLSMIVEDFERHGVLVEKYDVERRASDVAAGLRFGYTSNEVGFGWTNAVFEELLGEHSGVSGGLRPDRRVLLLR